MKKLIFLALFCSLLFSGVAVSEAQAQTQAALPPALSLSCTDLDAIARILGLSPAQTQALQRLVPGCGDSGNLPPGCTGGHGFSPTTGERCVPIGSPRIYEVRSKGGSAWEVFPGQTAYISGQNLPSDKSNVELSGANWSTVLGTTGGSSDGRELTFHLPEVIPLGSYRLTIDTGMARSNTVTVNVTNPTNEPPNRQPSITVTSPNGGETWRVGHNYRITWESRNVNQTDRVQVDLFGTQYGLASGQRVRDGKVDITLPNVPAGNYKIRISSPDNPSLLDDSDGYFTITSGNIPPPPPEPPAPHTRLIYGAHSSQNQFALPALGDNDPSTFWTSSNFAPQWVELNVGPSTVSKIRLLVDQSPAGQTTHRILAGPNPNPTNLVRTVSGNTSTNQWLEVDFSPHLTNVQYIRVLTTDSPSWVAWKEIEVYGAPATVGRAANQQQLASVNQALGNHLSALLLRLFGR